MNKLRSTMTVKKGTAVAAFVVALMLVGAPTAAFAEDAPAEPVTTEEPVVVQESTPATESTPEVKAEVTPTKPKPPTEEAPAPEAPADETSAGSKTVEKTKTTTPKKVFVCKYVGTPGVDERLQTGQNPISVSVNSIQNNQWDGTVPGYFSDAHDRSYVLAYDEGQAKPDVSDCPAVTPPPVVTKVCELGDQSAVKWDKNADLSMAIVTLKAPFTSCDVSLYSYETEGPNWETSGDQTPVDFDTVTLTTEHPTATLKVDVRGCFQQQDLAVGTKQKFDGVDGALPHYPESSTPKGLIDHWNGGEACPPVVFTCPAVSNGPVATNLDEAGWTHEDTRPVGPPVAVRHEYVDGAIRLFTNAQASTEKSTLYRNVSGPMATFGEPTVTYGNGSGGKPGLQYGIDADGDGTMDGMLVGEPHITSYNNHWSLFNSTFGPAAQFVKDGAPHTGGGYGSQWHGTWNEWIEAFPNAKSVKLGLSLGSGVLGSWEITSITGGCTKYTFDEVVVVDNNPAFTGTVVCGSVEFKFTNEVALKENETTGPAEFTYTDANGVTQTVSVEANETVTRTVSFGEDTGDHIVTAGVKGEVQTEFKVSTDCEPNKYFVNPEGPTFRDSCDAQFYNVPGTPQNATSSTDSETGDVHKTVEYVTDDGTYYVTDDTVDGERTVKVTYVSSDPLAVVATPGENDTYVVVENTAVWSYTFDNNEDCPKPPVPPVPPVTPPGGIDTGLSGGDPSAVMQTATYNGGDSSLIGVFVFIMLVASGALYARRRTTATR